MKGKEREERGEKPKQVGNLKENRAAQAERGGWEARAAQSGREGKFHTFLSILKKKLLYILRDTIKLI